MRSLTASVRSRYALPLMRLVVLCHNIRLCPKTLDSPDHYTIGWIAALDIELAGVTAMLDEEYGYSRGFARHETDNNVYAWG